MLSTKKLPFPKTLISNKSGYEFFAKMVTEVLNIKEDKIIFDLSLCNYFEPNLCCILGSACQIGMDSGKTFHMNNVEENLKKTLQQLGFLKMDEGVSIEQETNQVIYAVFRNTDADAIIQYLENKLLNQQGLPHITNDLKKEIARNILEIYINAIIHGNCGCAYSCGYINKRSMKAELHFTLVDIGETIKKNVNAFLKEDKTAAEAIAWATTGFNTTKIGTSGGLGLKLIQQFLKNNDGKIQIVSADGFWEYNKLNTKTTTLQNIFPGTIVNIIFNLKDTQLHYLDLIESPSISEIF